jgi:hypothetical protein
VALGEGGSRVVLAFAEPRGSKGRAGFSKQSSSGIEAAGRDASLIVLFAHPRLVQALPPGPPVILAWHRQRLMQQAVARWLRERVGP